MAKVFTRRLILSSLHRMPDGAGGTVDTWEEHGALWAEVRMRSGSLRYTEFGRTPRLQVRVTTYDLPDGHVMRPAVGDRLRDIGRTFEVQAVHSDDRRFVAILASEIPIEELPR